MFKKDKLLLTPVASLVKTSFVKILLREKYKLRKEYFAPAFRKLTVVHFQMGDIPCSGYEFAA